MFSYNEILWKPAINKAKWRPREREPNVNEWLNTYALKRDTNLFKTWNKWQKDWTRLVRVMELSSFQHTTPTLQTLLSCWKPPHCHQGLLIDDLSEGSNLLLFKLSMFTETFTTRGTKLIIRWYIWSLILYFHMQLFLTDSLLLST